MVKSLNLKCRVIPVIVKLFIRTPITITKTYRSIVITKTYPFYLRRELCLFGQNNFVQGFISESMGNILFFCFYLDSAEFYNLFFRKSQKSRKLYNLNENIIRNQFLSKYSTQYD